MARQFAIAVALIWVLAWQVPVGARENAVFSRIGTADGLSQESINAIAQDKDGFIWIGTQEGLNRYDGRRFRVFLNDAEDGGSLPHDWVSDIVELDNGEIWVGTHAGVALFNPATESFERLSGEGASDGTAAVSVSSMVKDIHGQIWIATELNGVFLLDPRQRSVQQIVKPEKAGQARAPGALAVDRLGGIWLAMGQSISRIEPRTRIISGTLQLPMAATDRVSALLPNSDNSVWVGTHDSGLMLAALDSGSVDRHQQDTANPYGLGSNRILALLRDEADKIWIGTDRGLHLWAPTRHEFHRYGAESGVESSISDDRVTCLYQDRGGVLWVGTYSGVNTWNARIGAIEHFRNRPDEPDSLSNNVVTSFARTSAGALWVGTFGGGLNELEPGSPAFRFLNSGNSSLSDDRVMTLAADLDGAIWIGTRNGGLNRYDPRSDSFQVYRNSPELEDSLSADAVTKVLVDRQGTVWASTFGGGINRMIEGGGFRRYAANPGDLNSLASNRVITASENPADGRIWFGTHDGGVSIHDPGSDRFQRISTADGLLSDSIVAIAFTRRFAWLGTRDSGLQRLNLEKLARGVIEFANLTRKSGLPSNAVMGVVADAEDRVWISTNKGLSVHMPDTGAIRHFDQTHGLQGLDFNSGAFLGIQDTIYFGGNNGFNLFRPDDLLGATNRYEPDVVLTEVTRLNRRMAFSQPVSRLDSVTFEYTDYVVGFEYAALDFTRPQENRYRHRLTGLESHWTETGNMSRATYANLPAGNFVFEVQAANSEGRWSHASMSLPVRVLPPPWKTWWAYAGYALLGLLLLTALVSAVARRARLQSERQAAAQLRTYLHCLDKASDSVAIVDRQGAAIYQNQAGLNTFGEGRWLPPSSVMSSVLEGVRTGEIWQQTVRDGEGDEARYLDISLTAVDLNHQDSAFITFARDVTMQKQIENELRRYREKLETLVQQRTKELETEISEHKATEAQLRLSLSEKELLLKEVHHRVKNNMQVISSLLRMQSETSDDPHLLQILTESQNRIRSMSLIHESLYMSNNFLEIDFNDYLSVMTHKLEQVYRSPDQPLEISIRAEKVALDIENAVPCGLIINELISNAMKHAFKGFDGEARVEVTACQVGSTCRIKVQDNGVGFPEGLELDDIRSMGMEIVTILTEQLCGTIELSRVGGSCFTIEFPVTLRSPQPEPVLASSAA